MDASIPQLETGTLRPGRGLGFGFRWVILGLLFLGITLNYIDRLVVAVVFTPDLKKHFAISPSQFGYIASSFAIAYACGQLFSGWMLDKIGTRVGYSISLFAWSICAMLTAFGSSWFTFAIFRAMLGLSESPSYPGAAKICAEWFPQRQRSFAFGWVNAGANMAAIITPLLVPWLVLRFGWQAAFLWTGAMGLALLVVWVPLMRRPEHHPFVSKRELALIHEDRPESTKKVPWIALLSYPQTWVLVAGKVLPDGIWWFFMSWLPTFFFDKYHLDLKNIGWPLVTIYLMADVGSVAGGGLSSVLIRRGMSVNKGRKLTMLLCGLCVIPIILAPYMTTLWPYITSHPISGPEGALWPTVFIVGIAVAGHQGFSSNLYTLCSDMFPKRAVASVAGMAGFCGYIGATAFNLFVGYWNQYTGNFIVPFFVAGLGYVVSLGVMHLVSRDFKPAVVNDDEKARGFPIVADTIA